MGPLLTGPGTRTMTVAFKEWASVVRAIERGVQDLIFRKGGIAEEGRGFTVEHQRFFLFPTYFHQQRAGLRDAYASLFDDAMSAHPPQARIVVTSWVEVKHSFVIERETDLAALTARHIYAPDLLIERLRGRHGAKLHALEIIVHRLETPLDLPLLDRYGGCRSWVDLEVPSSRTDIDPG